MEHKEGTKMIPSDILSRRPDFEQAPNVERALFPQLATLNIDELYERIKEAQKEDVKLPSNLTQKLPTNPDDILRYNGKIYIPEQLRQTVTNIRKMLKFLKLCQSTSSYQ